MRAAVPNHISFCGPGVLGSGDLAAPHTTGFEHLAQENIFASLPSSTKGTYEQKSGKREEILDTLWL